MADASVDRASVLSEDQDSQASSVRVSSGDKLPLSETSSSDSNDNDESCSTLQSSIRQDMGTCAAVARNTSDLSYDISTASEGFDSGAEPRDSTAGTGPSGNKRSNNDPCLSFDEECRELLAAMSMKGSINGDDDNEAEASAANKAEDIDDKEGDLPDDSSPSIQQPPPQLSSSDEQPTLETVAKWIKVGLCRNIVVLSGAGVSCAAGIPDFRTPGTGLYDNLEKFGLPYPEAVFDLSFYNVNPQPFVSLAAELWPGLKHSPTVSHSFVALLETKNLLLRNFTQNIDGLEILAGVSEDKLVECHGHFRTASCISCGVPFDGRECRRRIVTDKVAPSCPKCERGVVKPDIVFFGESLPVRFGKVLHGDMAYTDLLIVMGTSLKVAPVSLIPEMVSTRCPRVLINHELVGDFVPPGVEGNCRDIFEEGDCDDAILKLCKLLGWEEELMSLHASAQISGD